MRRIPNSPISPAVVRRAITFCVGAARRGRRLRRRPRAARAITSRWAMTFCAVLLFAPFPQPAAAQSNPGARSGAIVRVMDPASDEEAILRLVDDLFDAMRAKDGDALERIFHPNTRLITAGADADGVPEVTEIPISRFVASVLGSSSHLDERTYNPVVQVNRNLGTVWVEYDFFADGEFSHCGADAFVMGRSGAGWRIIQIAHTMAREGCPERGG